MTTLNWFMATRPKKLTYYEGLLIRADVGLHEQAMALFQQYVPQGSKVLDIGAGAGAFSKRLADHSYSVVALDVNDQEWTLSDIPFVKLDIDQGITRSINSQFDAACCLEVIEHVENPWSLLRDIASVLKPGGRLILSTPNITSFLSRLVFLRTGEFHQFQEKDLTYGHINPVTAFEISTITQRSGLKLLEVRSGGYLPVMNFSSLHLKRIFMNFLRLASYTITKGHKKGWCLFFVIEKPK